jgi:hypothetical protein
MLIFRQLNNQVSFTVSFLLEHFFLFLTTALHLDNLQTTYVNRAKLSQVDFFTAQVLPATCEELA